MPKFIVFVARAFLGVLLAASLAGCVLFSDDYQHGYIAFEGEDVYDTGTPVFIPDNAPSISQRYQPEPVGRSGEPIAKGHRGIDIVAPRRTPVIAPADGVVVSSYYEPMYGNRIMIRHAKNADGDDLLTRYYHLNARKVRKGDRVARGQLIGRLGATGLLAPHLHLHFETLRIEPRGPFDTPVPMNPHLFWWDGVGRITCYDKDRRYEEGGFRLTYPVPCRGIDWR